MTIHDPKWEEKYIENLSVETVTEIASIAGRERRETERLLTRLDALSLHPGHRSVIIREFIGDDEDTQLKPSDGSTKVKLILELYAILRNERALLRRQLVGAA
jgi:hypothetical protein